MPPADRPLRAKRGEIPGPAFASGDDMEHTAEREQVRPLVKRSTFPLLWRRVRTRGDRPEGIGTSRSYRRVEITKVRDVPFVEPDIVGRHVPMDQALPMKV